MTSKAVIGIIFGFVLLCFNGIIILGLWNRLDLISWTYKGLIDSLAIIVAFPELKDVVLKLSNRH